MKVAFHFNADAHDGFYGPPIDELVFRALLTLPRDKRHARLYCGDLILYGRAELAGGLEVLIRRLLDRRHWMTLNAAEFEKLAEKHRIYVVAAEGLTRPFAATMDARLREESSFLGALEVTPTNPVHWAMYDQSLIPKFRVIGDQLRLFYAKDGYEMGGDRDDAMFAHWRDLHLFSDVQWEDRGLRGTIFDEYDTLAHAQRRAELEEELSGQLGAVVNEILIRLPDLDPALPDALHAALSRFAAWETEEQLAQVAVSCRRFLERLANALYPPRNEPVKGRDVGSAQYRNRLWAYIDSKLTGTGREFALATLEDVGHRVDHLDALANKGVHAPKVIEADVQRLLVGLATLTYDIVTLEPPATVARLEPYGDALRRFMTDALGDET